jgi:hypothetical protein
MSRRQYYRMRQKRQGKKREVVRFKISEIELMGFNKFKKEMLRNVSYNEINLNLIKKLRRFEDINKELEFIQINQKRIFEYLLLLFSSYS